MIVGKMVDIGEDSDVIFLEVHLLCLPEVVDRTWLSMRTLFEYRPDTVIEHLKTHKAKKSLTECAKQSVNPFFQLSFFL